MVLREWLKRSFRLKQQHNEPKTFVFLRLAKQNRWKNDKDGNPPALENALKDMQLREAEEGLSLYRLYDEREVEELACIFSLTLRDNPCHFEYILFPESTLSGYETNPAPITEHPTFLSDRHFEIPRRFEEKLPQLAERILNSRDKKIGRIMKQKIVCFAVKNHIHEREELRGRISENWKKLIVNKQQAKSEKT